MTGKKMPELPEEEILKHTHGEVRKLIEMILNMPNWDYDVPMEDLTPEDVLPGDVRDYLKKVFYHVKPIAASLKKHAEDPDSELDEAAASYLKDQERGADELESLLQSILNAMEEMLEYKSSLPKKDIPWLLTTKMSMIRMALAPEGKGIESLLSVLRQEVRNFILLDLVYEHRNELPPKSAKVGSREEDGACMSMRHEATPPFFRLANISAATPAPDENAPGTRHPKALYAPLKTSSVKTILAPIAARMTDYPVQIDGLHLDFNVWGGPHVGGSNTVGFISIYACEIFYLLFIRRKIPQGETITKDIRHNWGVFGRLIIRGIAHEFRHTQQALLWDTDIPRVAWNAMIHEMPARGPFRGKAEVETYQNDAGETDASEFAEKVVNSVDERYTLMIARLALRYVKRQYHAWLAQNLKYFEGENGNARLRTECAEDSAGGD